MLVIHVRGGPHPAGGIPHQIHGRSGSIYSFWPYLPDSAPYSVVRDAIELVQARTAGPGERERCDVAFRAIRGVSFTRLVRGARQVTIFRSPTAAAPRALGVTAGTGFGRHITLTHNCWGLANRDAAVLRTAATLVHELAHCAGAAGGDSGDAEWTLNACGFPDQYDPDIRG